MQQIQQVDFAEMDRDIQEIKMGLLEILKERNPQAYKYFSEQINSQQQQA